MATYIVSLENLGYQFMNEIRIFNRQIGQGDKPSLTFEIYKDLMSQIVAAYTARIDPEYFPMAVASLPEWRTILYVEDQDAFFDIKRNFAARVQAFAAALYSIIQQKIPMFETGRVTYLMESVTATLIIINEFIEAA